MRTAYFEALESARIDVVRLGALASEAIHASVNALERRDTALAERVIAGDCEIDELRKRIETACIELIWRQQPVAGELRAVAAMLEIISDLERIGDYAVTIAKNALKLSVVALRPARVEVGRIANIAQMMLADAIRSWTERDLALAENVIARDEEVDTLYHRGIEVLQDEMQADPALVRAGTLMLFVLTTLERAGDRAQNVAWHTKVMISGA